MKSSLSSRLLSNRSPLESISVLAAFFVTATGAFYLYQWFFSDMSALGRKVITMKTNASLCFLLSGAALLIFTFRPQRLGCWIMRGLSTFVFLLGFLTLLENIFGFDFGIDQLILQEAPGTLGVFHPNRMGVPASLSFTLGGMALLWASFKRLPIYVAQSLGAAVLLTGLFGVLGYVYKIEPMFRLAQFTAIAFPTAITLMLFGIGFLFARPQEGLMRVFTAKDTGGVLLRELFFPFVFLAFITGYVELVGQRQHLYDPATGTGLMTIAFIVFFTVILYRNATALNERAAGQHQAEEALRNKQAELTEAQRLAHIGSWYLDAGTGNVIASSEVYYIQGLDPNKPYPKFREENSSAYTLTPESWNLVHKCVQKALADGTGYELDLQSKLPNGSVIWFTSRGEAVRDQNGKIVGLRGTVQNITRRKIAEEELRKSEERYRTLFEAMDEAYCVVEMIYDKEGNPVDYRFLETNPAFQKHTGLENAVGKRILELTPDHERYWIETYGKVAKTGEPIRFENGAAAMNNRWFDVFAFRLGSEEDHKVAILFQDITKRRNVELAIKKTNEELKDMASSLERRVTERTRELEVLNARLRELALELTETEQSERKRLAQILHDHLQQLLVAAKIRLNLLARKADTLEKESIDDAHAFIDQALRASRTLTAELRPPVLYEGGLNAALRFLVRKMEHQYNMKVNLMLTNDTEPKSDLTKVMIYESVQELLFNTSKYSGVSECYLRIERSPDEEFIIVKVHDQGRGFDVDTIWEKKEDGGFGLFSIRERIKALGGDFKAVSSPDHGATFEIRVPDVREDVIKTVKPAVASLAVASSGRKHLRILLADDHAIVRQSLSKLLSSQSFVKEIIEAEDGREALDKAMRFDPDIVVMDLNMPFLNGIEATRQLHLYNPKLKVIGLSVQPEQETEQAMKDAGAVAYFNKADDASGLLEAIKSFADSE